LCFGLSLPAAPTVGILHFVQNDKLLILVILWRSFGATKDLPSFLSSCGALFCATKDLWRNQILVDYLEALAVRETNVAAYGMS
jgi:hypothetical protein